MVVNWSKNAAKDLKNFNDITMKFNPTEYINELVNYIDVLSDNPRLGKVYSYINETIIRKLVFKEHIIYYCIDNNEIFILAVVHHLENTKDRINYIKKHFNE